MKCKNCGAELVFKNGFFVCDYCKSKYLKEELISINMNISDFIISGGVINSYKGNKQIVYIPVGVVAVGVGAFKDNLTVTEVIFSDTVKEIRNNAFERCQNLTKITGYQNIKSFGDYCFSFSGLKEVTIGPNVIFLGKGCFSNIENLNKLVYCPNKDLKLNHTFFNCHNLINVESNKNYFFPAFKQSLILRNNPNNKRPTYSDAFNGTSFIRKMKEKVLLHYENNVCIDCGGKIRKGLFHAKCKECGIDYIN